MNLADIVCSLELAEKLKELGVKQSSLFHWVEMNHETGLYRTVWEAKELNNTIASAFTVGELGDLLPYVIGGEEDGCPYFIRFSKTRMGEYSCMFWLHGGRNSPTESCNEDCGHAIQLFYEEKEADARAKMLIYLLENGLIKNE
jgi:hypothetical protein